MVAAPQILPAVEIMSSNIRATAIYVFATHGVLSDNAVQRLQKSPIKKVIITDTIPLPPEKRIDKIEVLSVDKLLADAMWRIHENESISKLFE